MVFGAPGIRVVEQDRGAFNAPLATHNFVYLFGSVDSTYDGDFEVPFIVRNSLTFSDDFGASNARFVDLIFAQDPNTNLQFIPVKIYKRYTVTVPLPVVDETVYDIDFVLDAVTVTATYTADEDSTTADAVFSLQGQLNGFTGVDATINTVVSNQIDVILEAGELSGAGNVTLVTISNGTTVTVNDFVTALNRFAALPDLLPGFLIIPEAFEDFSTSQNRAILISTLETTCIALNCVGLIDGIDSNNVNEIIADRNLYGSPRGHLSYFAPWVKVLDDTGVEVTTAPSPVVAAIWAFYVKNEGVKKSPLGTQKVIAGITGLTQAFTFADSEAANPVNVNLLLNVKRSGNVIWGGRTISNNPIYLFCNGRVIMNVINETAEAAFLPFIGRPLDIRGGVFHDLRNTGNSILFRLFAQGALYGETAEQAYLCVCDDSNNPLEDLDTGFVRVDLYAKTTPTIERILVTTIKVPITQEL